SSLAGFDTAGSNLTLSGLIGGDGGLRKTGAGTLLLTNTGNSFAGAVEIHQGTLAITGSDAVLGALPTVALEMTSNITFSGNGTLKCAGLASEFDLHANRWIAIHDGVTATIEREGVDRTTIIAGNIWDGGALEVGHLTKTGAGTVVLTGDNSYKGLTTV